MADEISVVSGQLAAAVEVTMDPEVSHQRRLEAYNACEAFKEKSPLCVQCGLYLAQRPEYSHFVRHFGLQLMEHCIKYRWYTMTQQEKIFIKENAMKLIECGMEGLLEDMPHMRDALSRVLVEMIKREWPQQWVSLLRELYEVASRGCIQTELVLLILLRLTEDVAVLQTLESTQRRKDIYQALTANMADLFSFFLALIEEHFQQYSTCSAVGNTPLATSHGRVVQVVLLTLSGFVEWVAMTHIMANDGRLLQILCLLLNTEHFQDHAAECLLQILSRKGKVEERRTFLILFSPDAMRCILQSADTSVHKNYQFLKKLTRVLTSLGSQLTTIWSKDSAARPPNFEMYLEAIISFSRHPSLTLVGYTNSLWLSFMKHELISKDEVFLSFVPKWVEAIGPKVVRVLYPSGKALAQPSPNSPEYFAMVDHDAEDEFNLAFFKYRNELMEAFKQATLVAPLITYSYVEGWLEAQLRKSAGLPEQSSLTSPLCLEWEALSLVMDAVLGKLVQANPRPPVPAGFRLLDLCLGADTNDPLVLSPILSCISALFVFLSMAPPESTALYLPRVLDKIFATLVFSLPGETKTQRSRGVKNLRRHAASLMVKIATKYPLLLLPVFSRIHGIVAGLQAKPDTLSTLESLTLQEALLLISNHLCDFERQSRFVGEVVSSISEVWHALTAGPFSSPQAFMSYVGLDKTPVEPSDKDIHGQNRSQILWCVDTLQGVVKRVSWPSDPEMASRGGFLVGTTAQGSPLYRNPAAPHVLPLLPGLLGLIQVLNSLATPQVLAHLNDGYQTAYSMTDLEKQNLLGMGLGNMGSGGSSSNSYPSGSLSESKTGMTPLQRMQHFISTVHENSVHTLGHAFHSLAHDIYQVGSLAQSLHATVLSHLEFVPDHRLRGIVRVFIKAFISYCPPSCYDSVLLPVLAHFTPYMFNRLCSRWEQLSQLQENGPLEEENVDTQEVIEDLLNRILTREYVECLKVMLYGGAVEGGGGPAAEPSMEMEEGPPSPKPTAQAAQYSEISELGARVLADPAVAAPVLLAMLKTLAWADSLASFKVSIMLGAVVTHQHAAGRLTPEVAGHVMVSVLFALQTHGHHDSNMAALLLLGTNLYSALRPNFPHLFDLMLQIPNVNQVDLQKLDERILKEGPKAIKVDKTRKEMFKKVTSPLIGCDVGQLFKRKVLIRDLPKLELPKRPPRSPPDDSVPAFDGSLVTLFTTQGS